MWYPGAISNMEPGHLCSALFNLLRQRGATLIVLTSNWMPWITNKQTKQKRRHEVQRKDFCADFGKSPTCLNVSWEAEGWVLHTTHWVELCLPGESGIPRPGSAPKMAYWRSPCHMPIGPITVSSSTAPTESTTKHTKRRTHSTLGF